jgi:hypothetical protein
MSNKRGDERMFAGGTPSFDERTGRYHRAVDQVGKAVGAELRARVEAWLKATGRNEFGDPAGTVYAGGTPLFDERSGRARDRFEHILANHPEAGEWEERR